MSNVYISEGHAKKLFYNQSNNSILVSYSDPNFIEEYGCGTFQKLRTYLHYHLDDIVDVTGTNDYVFACSGDKIFQWFTATGQFITIRKSLAHTHDYITKLFLRGEFLYAGLQSGIVLSWDIHPPYNSDVVDIIFFKKGGVDDIYAENDFIYAICNKSYMISIDNGNFQADFEKKIDNGQLRFVADPFNRNDNVILIVGENRLFPYSTHDQELLEPIDWNIQASHCITIDKNHIIYSNKLNTQINSIIIPQGTTYRQYSTTDEFLHFTYCGRSLYILHKTHIEKVPFKTINTYEEDSDDFESLSSTSDSITNNSESRNVSSCTNDNLITLEPYDTGDPIFMYIPNSRMKFEQAICSTKDELTTYYNSMKGTSVPDNIMAIFTSPEDSDVNGYGGKPTGKIIVKLPVNNIYVTMGSMKRMLSDTANKTWYLLPLFGGKRRRVGNIKGIFGASMNHGQIPGFIIFKAFTKDEIKRGVKVEESVSDYPTFLLEHARSLFILVGGEEGLTPTFIDGLIHDIVGKGNP